MNLSAQHKAICITLSISIVLLCILLNVAIVKQKAIEDDFFKVETLVEILPEELQEPKDETPISKAETNQGFNENSKHIAQAYEVITPAKDFDIEDFNTETDLGVEVIDETGLSKPKPASIDAKKRKSFNKAKSVLDRQKANTKKWGNKNSSVSYSLINREAYTLPIPVYLCDGGGKIVVTITVNKQGRVKNTSVNKNLSSSNACLQDYALQYAKKASFSLGTKDAQVGTITYRFQ